MAGKNLVERALWHFVSCPKFTLWEHETAIERYCAVAVLWQCVILEKWWKMTTMSQADVPKEAPPQPAAPGEIVVGCQVGQPNQTSFMIVYKLLWSLFMIPFYVCLQCFVGGTAFSISSVLHSLDDFWCTGGASRFEEQNWVEAWHIAQVLSVYVVLLDSSGMVTIPCEGELFGLQFAKRPVTSEGLRCCLRRCEEWQRCHRPLEGWVDWTMGGEPLDCCDGLIKLWDVKLCKISMK